MLQAFKVSLSIGSIFLGKLCLLEAGLCVLLQACDGLIGLDELSFEVLEFLDCLCKGAVLFLFSHSELDYVFFIAADQSIQPLNFKPERSDLIFSNMFILNK